MFHTKRACFFQKKKIFNFTRNEQVLEIEMTLLFADKVTAKKSKKFYVHLSTKYLLFTDVILSFL